MRKNSVWRKVLAVALSAVTLLGTGFTMVGQFVGTDVSVSAAQVYGDFEYNVNNDNTVSITGYTGNGGDVIIPDTINGKSVTLIGYNSFSGCTGLTSVIIPNSVKSISSGAFSSCTSLTSITIPDSVTYIGTSAFTGCTGLTSITIPDSVTEIGWNVFESCTGLTSITIPDSVTSIGGSIFFNCTNLINIDVEKNNPNYSSQDGVLFNKDKTRLIAYPPGKKGNYIIPDGVTLVTLEFCSCNNLTSITIPDSVTAIYGAGLYYFGLFHGCTSLESIHVSPNNSHYSSVDGVLFNKDKTELISYPMAKKENFYNIPNSVNTIKGYAFEDCTKLTNITMPNSVNYIGESAFLGCVGLKNITLPDSVKNIERCALGYFGRKYNYNKIDNFTIYGVSGSVAETYANNNNIPFVAVILNKSTISAEEIALGQTVTVNAKSSNDNCTYAVYYKKKAESKWTTKQDFGTNDTVTIKPANATDYDICIKVKDGSGKIVKKYFEVKVNAKLTNTSTLSAENVTLGQQVTVNGLAKGGVGEYQYQVVYKQTSQTKWTTAQDFSENATVTFKPAKATSYDVCVKVKDSNGTIVKKFFTVQVNAKLTNTSAVSATTIKKGSTVTVNGSATGGAGDYTYAVFYKQKSQSKWTTKQDFNDNADVSIKPAQATDYDICIKVKDKDGTIVKKYFTVTVTK